MYCDSFFSVNTGFYFFSALLQANASILAITGVYAIFKIQASQGIIEVIWKLINRGFSEAADIYKLDRLLNDPVINEKEIESIVGKYGLETFWGKWYEVALSIYYLKQSIKLPLILLCLGILLNMVGIIFSNYLHLSGVWTECSFVFGVAIFEIYIIYKVVQSILHYLK